MTSKLTALMLLGGMAFVFGSQESAAQETNPMLKSLIECKGAVVSTAAPKFPQNPATNCPDEFAWDLFIKLNHPVLAGQRGIPDPGKNLGDPGETVWESWKLRDEVLVANGCKPAGWDVAPAPASSPSRFVEPASKATKELLKRLPVEQAGPLFDPRNEDTATSETRLNRAAFDFIVANELYNVEGQLAFIRPPLNPPPNRPPLPRAIDLPPDSREIKSAWKILGPDDVRTRYHSVDFNGRVYGLVSLHIITKDLPQWFWSTFEHVDNPDSDVRAGVRFVDRHTNGGVNLPAALIGTKWENYRLKGSQTSFVDLVGEPTILANTIIEQGFQGSSSCVSCHARAAINQAGDRPDVFEKLVIRALDPTANPPSGLYAFFTGSIGVPSSQLLNNFTQLDFMWSLTGAQRRGQCP